MKTFIAVEIFANPGGETRHTFEFDPTAVVALTAVNAQITRLHLSSGLHMDVDLPCHDLRNRILYAANPQLAPT